MVMGGGSGGGGADRWDDPYASDSSDEEGEEAGSSAAAAGAAATSSGIDALYAAALEAVAGGSGSGSGGGGAVGPAQAAAAAKAPTLDGMIEQQAQQAQQQPPQAQQQAQHPSLWHAFEGGRRMLQVRRVGRQLAASASSCALPLATLTTCLPVHPAPIPHPTSLTFRSPEALKVARAASWALGPGPHLPACSATWGSATCRPTSKNAASWGQMTLWWRRAQMTAGCSSSHLPAGSASGGRAGGRVGPGWVAVRVGGWVTGWV